MLADSPSQTKAEDSPASRRIGVINDVQTFVLHHNTHPAVVSGLARDLGEVPGQQRMPRMSIDFGLTATQRLDLQQLLADQQNRRSPQYRKFLTPEEFGLRFGLNPADMEVVQQWLERCGFSDIRAARGRTSISFSGTAAQARSVFHTRIHKYLFRDQSIVANISDPELPKALENVARNIGGLSHYRAIPQFTDTTCGPGCNSIAPDDWETIYDVKPVYGAGFDGSGVTMAVVGQSDIRLSDLRAFRAAANLSPKDPTIVIPPGDADPGIQAGDQSESNLDLEWAGAIAKNADIVFVTASATTGNGVFDSLSYAIDENVASVVSISYGICEAQVSASSLNSMNDLLAQGAAQGITIIAASGDNGGAACDAGPNISDATHGFAVSFPASSPYVTAIGGTEIQAEGAPYWSPTNNAYNGSALSYISENVWNDGYNEASGGGASKFFSKPTWQKGPGVPSDGQRDIPDLAFAASPRLSSILYCGPGFCTNGFYNATGRLDFIGGTSTGTPSFAGLVALLIEKTGGRLGSINSNLYSLAQISSNIFHDIIFGGSGVYCTLGTTDCLPGVGELGFGAGPGYDQATGWGSVDANTLVEQWSGDIELTTNPTSLTIPPGSSATATITVAPQNNFNGAVSLSCSVSNSLIDVMCSLPSNSINTSGTAVVTITASKDAGNRWLKRLPKIPRANRPRALFLLALAGVIAILLKFRRAVRPVHLAGGLTMCVIALVFVSCGGGASGGSTASASPLALSCNMPEGLVQAPYSGGCTASGGTPPYIYSVTPGSFFPAGVSLNSSTGAISGAPTTPEGKITVSLSVSDSGVPAQTASQLINNFLVAGRLTLTCYIPTNGTTGSRIQTQGCNYGGGLYPFTTTVSAGALPPALTLNSQTGVVSGIPTKPGTYSFTLSSVDSFQPPQMATENDTITLAPPALLRISFASYVTVQANVAANIPISVTGGVPPYLYSITGGSLPPGLTINQQNGYIGGSPQTMGQSSYSLTVTDSYSPQQSATSPGTIIVTAPPPESGTVTITATSGEIVNTVTIAVSVPAPTASM